MKHTFKIFLLSYLITSLTGCNENKDNDIAEVFKNQKGTIRDFITDYGVESCGWAVVIDGVGFAPISLNNEFKVDGLNVIVDYESTDSFTDCNSQAVPNFEKINLLQIQVDTSYPANYLQINDDYFELSKGSIETSPNILADEDAIDSYNTQIYLYSPELSLSVTDIYEFSGIGDVVIIELYSQVPQFTSGVYSIHLNHRGYLPETFQGALVLDYNFETSIGLIQEIDGGVLSISKADNKYMIHLAYNNISCLYNGELTSYTTR